MAEVDFILKPLADKIVVRPDKRTLSSVLIVENKEHDNMGVVVAVGPGKKLSSTKREEMPIEVGQYVRFGTMSDTSKDEYLKYQEYFTNGERYLMMSWKDVCFVQEPNNV